MIVYHNKKTEPIECVKGCVCMKRIGMLTSGGDCQALNAAMRGVVKGLCESCEQLEIYGFLDGYKGITVSWQERIFQEYWQKVERS